MAPFTSTFRWLRQLIPALLWVIPAIAQEPELLDFKRITGLSQNTIYSIQFDARHFMWLGTSDGINRYDGVEITTYKPPAEKTQGALQGRVIRSRILPDDANNLWFSTESNITYLEQQSQQFIQLTDSQFRIPSQYYSANPVVDFHGSIWCISESKGIIAINRKTHEFTRYPVPDGGLLYPSAAVDESHRLWITGAQGLYRFDLQLKEWTRVISGQKIELVFYSNQHIYYSREHLLFRWDGASRQSTQIANLKNYGTSNLRCRHIVGAHRGWIGDNAGNIFLFNPVQETLTWKGNVNEATASNAHYPVLCIQEDEAGQLWIGTDVLGLQKATISPLGFHRYPQAIPSSASASLFIKSILERNDGTVWMGTYEKGLIEYNPKTGISKSVSLPFKLLSGSLISLVKQDSKGNLWISAAGSIYLKPAGSDAWITLKIPIPEDALIHSKNVSVLSLNESTSDWMASTQIGLYKITENKGQFSIRYVYDLGQTIITDTWQDPQKHLFWVGYENSGLAIYNNSSEFREFSRLFYNNGSGIKSFEPDLVNKDLLWIASMSGLIAYHLPTGQYRFYQESDGLANSFVYGIIPEHSALWVSTNQGISKALLFRNHQSPFPEIQFSNYGMEDGLPALEFNTGAFHKGASGRFYFGSINGLCWFYPDSVRAASAQVHLQFLQVSINNTPIPDSLLVEKNPVLHLAYHQNYLYAKFRGIEWRNPERIKYSYQIKGIDSTWIQCGSSNELRYNNLPPGNYELVIRAIAGNDAGTSRTILIIIHPPFWKAWWFYMITAVVLFSSIILITATIARRKLEQQVEELKRQQVMELERQRISREMHDDIGAGLTQITLMSEFVRRKIPDEPELDAIAQTSRNLISSMSEIIWSLQPQHRTLEQLLAYLREQIVQLLEAGSIRYQIDFPELGGTIQLEPHQMRNLLLIGKEIIHNAVKHSESRNVQVQVRSNSHHLEFSVTDDGRGFDVSQISAGNGLRHLKQRCAELDATLEIQSSPGNGTHIQIQIPLKYPGTSPEI